MDTLRWYKDQDWAYLKVSGKDRVDFLHRLSTNTIPRPGQPSVHNFFLSVNAKILAEFWVEASEDVLNLFCPRTHVEALKENIDRYHFGEDIVVEEPQGTLFVVEQADFEQPSWDDPRYAQLSLVLVAPEDLEGFTSQLSDSPFSEVELEVRRISQGWARDGLDYTEQTLFLEMAQGGDFSESKGCYPGQEIVARVLHRGRLNRSLRAFESSSQVPTDWVAKVNNKEVARVTSTVPVDDGSIGFLYVRREHGEDGAELSGSGEDGETVSLTVRPRTGELRGEDSE